MNQSPLMLDVDTGVDDAVAIAFALGMKANLVAISTVAGNVNIDMATDNTLRVLEHLGARDIPVFRGASRPLAASLVHAPYVHGEDGLAGVTLPPASSQEHELTAPEAIIAMAEEFAGELVFVSLGPATNLAIALSLRPDIVEHIARVVIMGGSYFTAGNRTPVAEFNAYIDPDAMSQVYQADWNEIFAVGLDVTHQVEITEDRWNRISDDAARAAALVRAISGNVLRHSERGRFYLHDPLAVAVALDPTLVTTVEHAVSVVSDGEKRGQAVVSHGGRVNVATAVETRRFLNTFGEATSLSP